MWALGVCRTALCGVTWHPGGTHTAPAAPVEDAQDAGCAQPAARCAQPGAKASLPQERERARLGAVRAAGAVPSPELAHAHPLPAAKGEPVLLRERCQRAGPSLAEPPSGPALLTVVCSPCPGRLARKLLAPKAGGRERGAKLQPGRCQSFPVTSATPGGCFRRASRQGGRGPDWPQPSPSLQCSPRAAAGGGGGTARPHWAKAEVKHWFSRAGGQRQDKARAPGSCCDYGAAHERERGVTGESWSHPLLSSTAQGSLMGGRGKGGRGRDKHHSCCSRVCSVLESAAAPAWLGPGQAAHLAVVRARLVHEGAVLAGPHGR